MQFALTPVLLLPVIDTFMFLVKVVIEFTDICTYRTFPSYKFIFFLLLLLLLSVCVYMFTFVLRLKDAPPWCHGYIQNYLLFVIGEKNCSCFHCHLENLLVLVETHSLLRVGRIEFLLSTKSEFWWRPSGRYWAHISIRYYSTQFLQYLLQASI